MSHAPFFTVNFADDDGAATTRKLSLRTFSSRDEAQKFIDERKQALDALEWRAIIVEHQPEERET